ncbi:MAG: TrkH family potassium uptake protein [Clostridiales bacterium]|jgi:trk system potassium uptake protein TrkH|nr:TrkH family potassium uptake protein [Clostridiales bacterium]
MLALEGAFMIPALVIALALGEKASAAAFAEVIGFCLVIGAGGIILKADFNKVYAKEGYVTVALAWILLSLVGALPFTLSGSIPNYIDAIFECVSGFTTTGASILKDVEALPRSMLYWRSFTHWLGGMGVLVFILAIMPRNAGSGTGFHILRAESPGPSVGKFVPKMRSNARILYGIYVALTFIMALLLIIFRMPVFDAVCITFGTAGTGGFGILADSCASYTSAQQIIITVFMILFGINFSIYFLLLIGNIKAAVLDEETIAYLAIIAVSTLIIMFNVRDFFPSWGEALKNSAFQVGSIITTSGFATTDFNKWPELSKTILVTLMFIGASAGSTGGGLKVSRIIILLKSSRRTLKKMIHPQSVKHVRLSRKTVDIGVVHGVNIYIVVYCIIYALSLLLISIDDFDFTTNFTAVAATINNVGPGLGAVGPAGNFASYSFLSKLVLSADMLIGRLEIFPMLLLFSPGTWKRAV